VAAQGGGHDNVEDLAWVPAEWRAKSYTPEKLRSIGAPWLLSDDVAAARKDPQQWPMPRFAFFLSVLRGSMVACLILGSALLERGCSLHASVTFLGNLSWNEFEKFVITHCLFADLVPGNALWVPYGWICVLLTRTLMDLSHALHVPYVCSRMIHDCPMKQQIVEFAKRATQEWGTLMGCNPCLSMSREALAWLSSLTPLTSCSNADAAITLQAIEDVHDSQA